VEQQIGMPEKFGELKSFINQILIFGDPSLYRPTNLANINMPADVLYRVNTDNRLVACDVQPKSHKKANSYGSVRLPEIKSK
jgi:hypothetical protein